MLAQRKPSNKFILLGLILICATMFGFFSDDAMHYLDHKVLYFPVMAWLFLLGLILTIIGSLRS